VVVPVPSAPRARSLPWWGVAAVAWALLVASGFALVTALDHRPGAVGATPAHWPSETAVRRAQPPAWTLVVFLHPKCPCSRATVRELAHVTTDAAGRVDAHVLFVRDTGTPAGWEEGELMESAKRVTGVRVGVDADGVEAARFGAMTSGHAALYDAAGRLRFCGGITSSRGHEGGNVGRSSVTALLRGEATAVERTSVFGCPLRSGSCPEGTRACSR
jgi:hypothetical protein